MPQYGKIRKGKKPKAGGPGTRAKAHGKPMELLDLDKDKGKERPKEPKASKRYIRRSRLL
jgi:hypothetical protein